MPPYLFNVLSESLLHLLLWPIFRQSHPNFIDVRPTYASEIWAQLTKNLLTKSSTERFRENILFQRLYSHDLFCLFFYCLINTLNGLVRQFLHLFSQIS